MVFDVDVAVVVVCEIVNETECDEVDMFVAEKVEDDVWDVAVGVLICGDPMKIDAAGP